MPKPRISLKEKISYGLGDFGGNLLFTLISSYLLFFYTDVGGIAIGTVSIIMALVRLVDAFANPLVGLAIDKTNTRWGKTRPYLLFTALPVALLAVLTFCTPDLPMPGKIAYAAITYAVYSVVFTINNTPYSTLLSNITDNERERLSFGMFRTLGMSAGGFVATGLTLPLVALLGQGDSARGYFWTVLLYAVLCCVFFLVCFLNTTERIPSPPDPQPIRFPAALKLAFRSRPWVIFCILQLTTFSMFTMRSENTLYFSKYILGNENFAALLLASSSIVTVLIAFFVPLMASKLGKKNCIQLGLLLCAVSLILMFFFGRSAPAVLVLHLLACGGSNICTGMFFVMIAETVDHSEWLTGKRQQGLLNSLSMFISRLGIMMSSLISSQILARLGYQPDAALPDSALFGIRFNYTLLPAALAILGFILCFFYRLDEIYPQVLADLQSRRNQPE